MTTDSIKVRLPQNPLPPDTRVSNRATTVLWMSLRTVPP